MDYIERIAYNNSSTAFVEIVSGYRKNENWKQRLQVMLTFVLFSAVVIYVLKDNYIRIELNNSERYEILAKF